MKLHQLRYLCAIVDQRLNVSRAASLLNTSQPGISKQIRLLEQELAVRLFERRRTKLTALTSAGNAVVASARRILLEVDAIPAKARGAETPNKGTLVVATTQTHARYVVLPAFKRLRKQYPNVMLKLLYENPSRITELVSTGKVDVGISTDPLTRAEGISYVAYYRLNHAVVVVAGHPLLSIKSLKVEDLENYPLVTYDATYRFGRLVHERFQANGIAPNIVINTTNFDIAKAYVEAEVGIAILPSIVFDPVRDAGLRIISANHLFEPSTCHVMTLQDRPLEQYQHDFIQELRAVSGGLA